MGYTFKENCNDIRNTKVRDLYKNLIQSCRNDSVYDPYVNDSKSSSEKVNLISKPKKDCRVYDAIVITVGHNFFKEIGIDEIRSFMKEISILYDLKYIFDKDSVDLRL